MEELLCIDDVYVQFKTERATVHALNGMSLKIYKGESIGLVGETSAGKTTTALAILKLLADTATFRGQISYKGQDVYQMKDRELLDMRGGKVSMIFQNPLTALNPVFTVGEQIAMVLRAHKGMDKKAALQNAGKLLEMVGIPQSRVGDYPNQFSGGMRQRVGIAAGLSCNPELLIADEPTTALDVTIQAQILELMKKLQMQYDTSLLMISHNLGIISELCQKVAVMYAGRVIEYGTAREVFSNPQHPYTQGLLGALPSLDDEKERLMAVPGDIANPRNLPTGCRFHPRCSISVAKCRDEQPPICRITQGHCVECHVREAG